MQQLDCTEGRCDAYAALETRDYSLEEPAPHSSPFTATYIVRTLRAYRGAIGLVLLAVAVGYLILAITAFLLSPSLRVTSMSFQLEFSGAEKGQYPNGSPFASSEITSTPVMLKSFKQNDLARFTTFKDFGGSVYVTESNEAREALSREYQARLADPRLTSIDRERIQREYELRSGSITKNQFSINYARKRGDSVPDALAKKVLNDILQNWAAYATNEQHVLEYRVSVLSPDVVAPDVTDTRNPIINTIILRGNVGRLRDNIDVLRRLPNAELMRTSDGLTLNDISVRLEDAVRYRLDPLVDRIAAARLDDRSETIRFLQTQLAYDRRTLDSHRTAADTVQRTLGVYMNADAQRQTSVAGATPAAPAADDAAKAAGETATLMPQISDTFLDRLIQLTSRSADTDFRQKLATDYQVQALSLGPAEAAVAYDESALGSVRNVSGPVTPASAEQVEREITTTRGNVRQLAAKVQELHKVISENLNPATQLVTASTPRTRVNRSLSLQTAFVLGILLLLVTLVLGVILSIFHSRVREGAAEEAAAA
ncbi:MAG TPA: hypothetical protein VGD79_06740 [Thermoanaerobaculia bacterium]